MKTSYDKLFITLRYYLLGAKYYTALKALDLARNYHNGQYRKDKVTPYMIHPVEGALYITTLKDLINEELTIACFLLHDVLEDCPVTFETLAGQIGLDVAEKCELLNKNNKSTKEYFDSISNDCIASIVKGADRINNVNTMKGVFSTEKQIAYTKEINEYFLPMLKKSRNQFPQQMLAYFNITHMLKSQINLLGFE